MKTPIEMLNDISGEITDAASLLELLYKSTTNGADTDSGICCIVRSLLSTSEKAQNYIEHLSGVSAPPPPNRKRVKTILRMMFFMRRSVRQNYGKWLTYIMKRILQEKTATTLIA
ncbi:hypothetical protein ACH31I_27025 [Klebsiella michiganensis]|uniref:hypothetical protein n=1 Tax=Klebsiella michiganensis TaxID=1134687 RepID=UPI003DA86C02